MVHCARPDSNEFIFIQTPPRYSTPFLYLYALIFGFLERGNNLSASNEATIVVWPLVQRGFINPAHSVTTIWSQDPHLSTIPIRVHSRAVITE